MESNIEIKAIHDYQPIEHPSSEERWLDHDRVQLDTKIGLVTFFVDSDITWGNTMSVRHGEKGFMKPFDAENRETLIAKRPPKNN